MRKSWIIGLTLAASAVAGACSTPVFRYALERWEADPYRLMVFTAGELTADQQQTLEEFRRYERFGYRSSPLQVETVDSAAAEGPAAEIQTAVAARRAAPYLALLYPAVMNMNVVVWDGELTTNALHRLIMSPARLETARRLLAGDAAVWLLIGGGDPQENRAVRERVERKLRELESSVVYNEDFLQLVAEAGSSAPPLKFSVLEIDRHDPGEAVLLAMLTRVAPEAAEHAGPMIVPVFGQGRAVALMMGEYLADEYIERVVAFLTGACSCEVKSLNPGFDLLIPVDWIGGVTEEYVFDSELPPLTSPSAATEPPPDTSSAPADKPETRLLGVSLILFSAVVVAVLALATWRLLRRQQP